MIPYNPIGKRVLDLILLVPAFCIATLCLPVIFVIFKLTDSGPFLHWSKRIGRDNYEFLMPKIRTMRVDTPQLATDELTDVRKWISPLGSFLRRSSLDELPQVWCVLLGQMSFVGPRPALFNQHGLIELRTKHNVQQLLPGITGLAQINGRDELDDKEKTAQDCAYLGHISLGLDLKIITSTVFAVIRRHNLSH